MVKPTRVLNFGHPLSPDAHQALERALGGNLNVEIIRVQIDTNQTLVSQVHNIINGVTLSSGEWQNTPFVVVLPGLAAAAATILAEIHGRCGYFPRIVTLVSGEDRIFRFSEIIDLQEAREAARQTR